jgi:hypothetical protein
MRDQVNVKRTEGLEGRHNRAGPGYKEETGVEVEAEEE